MLFIKKIFAFFSLKQQRKLLNERREKANKEYFFVDLSIYRLIVNPVMLMQLILLLFKGKKQNIQRSIMLNGFLRENTLVVFNVFAIPTGLSLGILANHWPLFLFNCIAITTMLVIVYLIYAKINGLLVYASHIDKIEPFGLYEWLELHCVSCQSEILHKCIKDNHDIPFTPSKKNRL